MEIENTLERLNLPKNEILFLHVKLKGISDEISYKKVSKQIIEILGNLYSPKTILVPTFTYSYTKTGVYNRVNSPSEVGRFGEEIRNQFNPSHRTLNPVFSVIDSENYFSKSKLKEESAFGKGSLLHLLHDLGHVVVNINLDEFMSTYLHFLEYHHQVPYRFIKEFPGEVKISDEETKSINYKYYVRYLDQQTTWDREKIKNTLLEKGGLELINLNNLEVTWSHSKNMEQILGEELETDKNYLLR